MIGKTNVGGGGSGNAFAYIGVTYPVGATVTCSDGRKTLRAKDTTGMYVFGVPYAATWTLTATLGGVTNSKSVVISSLWQDVITEMTWWDEETLFDNGDQAAVVTGGWQFNPNLTLNSIAGNYSSYNGATINNSINISLGSTNKLHCFVQTVNPIDLSGYSRMVIALSSNVGASNQFFCGLASINSGNIYNVPNTGGTAILESTQYRTITINLAGSTAYSDFLANNLVYPFVYLKTKDSGSTSISISVTSFKVYKDT